MPASRKKSSKKIIKRRSTRRQRGRISEKLILILVVVLLLVGGGLWFFKPWNYLSPSYMNNNSPVVVTKPTMDMGRARMMTIYPEKDNMMQIITREKVRVTLEVPKGAIKEKTVVQLIPFYHDEKSKAPTAGVVVGPASVNFAVPVTLSFNFADSEFKNIAPKTVLEEKLRTTGLSQVLQIDSKATTLTPTLIARGIETETYLPARILSGGAYVFSLDGGHQIQNAKKALDTEGMHTLTVMESATTLLFNNQQLTDVEMKKAKAAVVKILSKKEPPAFEYYAALVLQKKISTPSFSFIPKAYAYSVDEGYFQYVCRNDDYSIEEYIGFAKSAQLMGHDSIGDSCLNKAKNKVAEETKRILEGKPDVKTVINALKNVQLLGLDEDTNLDERLTEKAKESATEAAKEVANDPTSTAVEAAKALQTMESVGADSGPTYDKLKEKVTSVVDQKEADIEKANDEYQKGEEAREAEMDKLSDEANKNEEANEAANEKLADEIDKENERLSNEYEVSEIEEEQIIYAQAMSALGIGLLQAMGFDGLDQQSLHDKFAEISAPAREMAAEFYSMCVEAEIEDCGAKDAEIQRMLKEADELSYRAETEIGSVQSQAYEQPEYLEENGDFSLYFEEDLTPTPEEDQYGMPDGENSEGKEYCYRQENEYGMPGEEICEPVQEEDSNYGMPDRGDYESQSDGCYGMPGEENCEEQQQEEVQEDSNYGMPDRGSSGSQQDDSNYGMPGEDDVQGANTWKFQFPAWWPF